MTCRAHDIMKQFAEERRLAEGPGATVNREYQDAINSYIETKSGALPLKKPPDLILLNPPLHRRFVIE